MKHIALTLVSAAVLALPVGAVHAQQSGAKKPAATKKAPAKKPARKAPAKTVKAVEANTPVQTPTDRLTNAEMEIAKRVHTGKVQCELGADVTVAADEKNPGFFHVSTGKQRFFMHPFEFFFRNFWHGHFPNLAFRCFENKMIAIKPVNRGGFR